MKAKAIKKQIEQVKKEIKRAGRLRAKYDRLAEDLEAKEIRLCQRLEVLALKDLIGKCVKWKRVEHKGKLDFYTVMKVKSVTTHFENTDSYSDDPKRLVAEAHGEKISYFHELEHECYVQCENKQGIDYASFNIEGNGEFKFIDEMDNDTQILTESEYEQERQRYSRYYTTEEYQDKVGGLSNDKEKS